MLRSIRITD